MQIVDCIHYHIFELFDQIWFKNKVEVVVKMECSVI